MGPYHHCYGPSGEVEVREKNVLAPTEGRQEWVTEPCPAAGLRLPEWGGSRSEAQWRPPVAGARVAPRGLEAALRKVPAPRRDWRRLLAQHRRRDLRPPPHPRGLPPTRMLWQTSPPEGERISDTGPEAVRRQRKAPSLCNPTKCDQAFAVFILFINIFILFPRARCSSSYQPCEVGTSPPPILQTGKPSPRGGGGPQARLVRPRLSSGGGWRAGPAPPADRSRGGNAKLSRVLPPLYGCGPHTGDSPGVEGAPGLPPGCRPPGGEGAVQGWRRKWQSQRHRAPGSGEGAPQEALLHQRERRELPYLVVPGGEGGGGYQERGWGVEAHRAWGQRRHSLGKADAGGPEVRAPLKNVRGVHHVGTL